MATRTRTGFARGEGWLLFAATMLGLAGVWNVLQGMLAIGDSKVYGPDSTFVFSNLRTWGWIILVLGAVQILAAFGIGSRNEYARWFGIGVAGVNLIGQLAFIPVYPFWALAVLALDVLVIYALTVYGGEPLESPY
jgi:hypothetical protein